MTDRMQVWGHRGWSNAHPDNSMAAIGAAFGVAPVVEIDVRSTRDGVLVLSHDPEIQGLVISETDWDGIRSLDLGGGQRPVTLNEARSAFPDRRFDIEIKNAPHEAGFDPDGVLVDAVLDTAAPGDVVTSFHWASLDGRADAARARGIETGLLLHVAMPIDDVIDHALRHGHRVVAPSSACLEGWALEPAVADMHEAGLFVVTWTVNDLDTAIRMGAARVDAVITDDPGDLVAGLRSARM